MSRQFNGKCNGRCVEMFGSCVDSLMAFSLVEYAPCTCDLVQYDWQVLFLGHPMALLVRERIMVLRATLALSSDVFWRWCGMVGLFKEPVMLRVSQVAHAT
jgi:hypothetical protein